MLPPEHGLLFFAIYFASAERNGHRDPVDSGVANIGAGEGPDVAPESLVTMAGVAHADITLGSFTQFFQRGINGFGLSCGIDVTVIHNKILLFLYMADLQALPGSGLHLSMESALFAML